MKRRIKFERIHIFIMLLIIVIVIVIIVPSKELINQESESVSETCDEDVMMEDSSETSVEELLTEDTEDVVTEEETNMHFATIEEALAGKYLSIIGDSISTYAGYSDDTESNSTIGDNAVWYYGSNTGINSVDQTWWMQAADLTGMQILVNNSWSGSQLLSGDPDDGYLTRAVNLHGDTGENAGKEPDVIAVYIGINDFNRNVSLGIYSENLFQTMKIEGENDIIEYTTPSTFTEAYMIMIDKIVTRYKEADVFLFTYLPNGDNKDYALLEEYNVVVRNIASHYGLTVVDLYQNGELTTDNYTEYYGDKLIHPNEKGMDVITEVFVRALEQKYLDENN